MDNMKLKLDGGGEVCFAVPQQRWRFGEGDENLMQVSRFAGQDIMAITDDEGCYDLHYLNHKTGGFTTMESAKAAAPAFTRQVLAHLTEMIFD